MAGRFKNLDTAATAEETHAKTALNPKGRPAKREEDKLTEQVIVRFTKEQKGKLDDLSARTGVSVANLIRMALMKEGHIG